MVTYTKEEIISSSIITRRLGDILNRLKNRQFDKIAIIRNNQMEAVIVPVEDYEELKERAELSEHVEIFNIIKEREKDSTRDAIAFETILEEYGVSEDDL